MTSWCRSRLKMSVTLMLRPSAIIRRIGSTPAAVAGIFTIRLRRLICSWRLACRGFGARRVVRQLGSHLDARVAVEAVGEVVRPGEHVARAVDVGDDELPVVVDDGMLVERQLA